MEPHLGEERTQNPQQTVPTLTGLASWRPGLYRDSGNSSSVPESGLGAARVTGNTAQTWVPKGSRQRDSSDTARKVTGSSGARGGPRLTPEGVREGSVEEVKEKLEGVGEDSRKKAGCGMGPTVPAPRQGR